MANKKKLSPAQLRKVRSDAGKKRAASALRIDGKFVSTSFKNEVQRIADSTGYAGNLQKFLSQNETVITELFNSGELKSAVGYADSTIFKQAAAARGKTYLRTYSMDGEPSTQAMNLNDIKFHVLEFVQYLFANYAVAGVAFKPSTTFKSDYIVSIPSITDIETYELDDQELIEFCDMAGVEVWISEPKDKKKREALELKKLSKLIKVNMQMDNVKPKRKPKRTAKSKSGTKPKKR